jgi:adenylyltransferase/sulfurtransferase
MSRVDWDLINKRRSCSLLARRAIAQRGTPTTPTTASIIGAIQVAEAIKYLHGLDSLAGAGFVFEGLQHSSYKMKFQINPDCPWHEPAAPIESFSGFNSDSPFKAIWAEASRRLGGLDALDLSREIVEKLECPRCRTATPVWQPAEKIHEDQLTCACGEERGPVFLHSISENSAALELSPKQAGLPIWDIVWARNGEQFLGLELAGDNPWQP